MLILMGLMKNERINSPIEKEEIEIIIMIIIIIIKSNIVTQKVSYTWEENM